MNVEKKGGDVDLPQLHQTKSAQTGTYSQKPLKDKVRTQNNALFLLRTLFLMCLFHYFYDRDSAYARL